MKRIAPIFVCFVVVFLSSAVWADVEIRGSLPSFAKIFGIGPKTSISVTNNTPFWAELIALNKGVGVVMPGATVYEKHSFEFDYTELPLIAVMHDEGVADTSQYGDFVGVAATVLRVTDGHATSWVIRNQDIQFPDARSSYSFVSGGSPYPAPDVERGGKVDFPRIVLAHTTAVQFANVTYFDATIKLDGETKTTLATGAMCYVAYQSMYAPSLPVELEVTFSDRGRLVGDYHETFYVYGGNNPRGIQFILTPDKIRRY